LQICKSLRHATVLGMRINLSRALTASVFLGVSLSSASAFAADPPPCEQLDQATMPQKNVITRVYIESGDTQTPMLQRLGAELLKSNTPLRIIFRERPTCTLAKDMFGTDPRMNIAQDTNATTMVVTPRPVRYIPDNTVIPSDQKAPICTVPADAASAKPIQLGIGATYLSSCGLTQPTTITVVNGPVQAYGFVTNLLSNQVAITAEEGYLAFGFAEGAGNATPWILKNLKFQRAGTASTTLTMAAAIRVPAPKMLGTVLSPDTSANIVTQVQGATANPDAALGTLGMDLYDTNRDKVKLLAFRTFQQRFAYYPDATSTSFDKSNVRDGHYAPWAPTPYIAPATNGVFTDPAAQRIFQLVMGLAGPAAPTTDDVDGLKAIVQSSLVPECAMKVTRTGDGADFSLYSDPNPCGCYFEANVSGGTTSCTACTTASQCGTGVCRYGYCEAK